MPSRNLYVPIATCLIVCALSHSIRAAEPNATPAAKSAPISSSEATKFVKEYYAALSRSDVSNVVAKFAESVDYEREGQRDRAYIEKDLHDYVKRWPVRNLKPEMVAVSPKDDGSAELSFNLLYSVANESNKKSLSGHSVNAWVVRRVDGEIQIVSRHEVVYANPKPAIEKTLRAQSHEDEEALSDEELKKQGDIQVEIPTAKSSSKPSATPAAKLARKNAADFVIALDIGHSPLRGGAISARGVFEYQFNRRLVAELFAQLQSLGFTRSFVINPQGDEISLAHRSVEANEQKADLFFAIHHDSVKDRYLKNWEVNGKTQKYCDDFHGYSIFVSRKNARAAESAEFAAKLGRALLDTGLTPTLHHAEQEKRPVLDKEKGIYAFDDLVVLKIAKMPAVLLECGVIVNRTEEEKLNDPVYRKRLIGAIDRAIQDLAQSASTASKNN
ncbi:MAG TPA: N-acetylmuramoyl-L-alanine amidase [Chthoniobacterales bacterium]|nr:N-acetylmuramoyl-L-alanine amidase [Chthoniobacterales bacterium]